MQNLDINPEAPAPRDMVDLEVRDVLLILLITITCVFMLNI